jgi:Domain of unknown function (DUF4258)
MAHYVIGGHARFEMKRRGLSEEVVRSVLEAPDQLIEIRPGRVVMQSQMKMNLPPKTYLIRDFVDVDRDPHEVVTLYRTSKVSKYWRQNL